jgi:uncharacterized protein (TIGR02270 family)
MSTAPILPVIHQHAVESAALRIARTTLLGAPNVNLSNLGRHDNRIAAHLDGLAVAGDHGWAVCRASLQEPSPGVVFAAAVRAIEDGRIDGLRHLGAFAETLPEMQRGLVSAFGWVEGTVLRGTVVELLSSRDPRKRVVGIAACAMHRVDPGIVSADLMRDTNSVARARALRAAGELGHFELVSTCAAAMNDEDPDCQFWAAWTAVLLGDRKSALDGLVEIGLTAGSHSTKALRLAFQAMNLRAAHAVLKKLAQQPDQLRTLVRCSGIAGDPTYVPWLMQHMLIPNTARVAGEAFSLITGLDLAYLDLDRKPPEAIEAGPNDDPNDSNVDMDPDDGLPWPDPERITNWWSANGSHFASGTRYFMGAPVTRENCLRVLNEGFQRQRILAAHYLCLMQPGTPLFEWRAPVWRQRSLLATMA